MATPNVDMSDYDRLGCLHDLFIQQVKKTPKKVAVVNCDGSKTTYEELDRITDLLASKLQRLGLGRNKVGGILMERSLEYTVSYISILKAGGAYLPIEVSWPAPLLESVLNDATPSVICTKEIFCQRVNQSSISIVELSGDWLQKLKEEQKNLPLLPTVKTSLDDTAYVVYSSGTTGTPKGIQCPHRGAVFSYTWRHRAYPYEEQDREACNVFFVWEMLRPLIKGIPMYIIPDDVIYDPPKLANFICTNKISRMLFTPSLFQALLEYKGIKHELSLQSLRHIIYCGEVVTTALKDKVAALMPWITQLNLYSISECHDVSNADLSNMPLGLDRQFCPVGKLIPGVHAVIMDEDLNIKSVGEAGEIFIGGPGLACGYLNRPDLNKVRFISRPEHVNKTVGDRLYRTGDWGYVLSDGSLEVCGRCDTMVKIRGYTVELEAVKVNLLELSGVISACLQTFGSEGEDKLLVAFIVLQEEVSLSPRDLRSELKKRLPFYMIPSRFVILKSIPVVEATGKLDSKALAALYSELKKQSGKLEVAKVIGDEELPISEIEMKIAHIWSELLSCFILDTEESFFDIGGHSLLAALLTSKLNEQFGTNLTTASIFKYPTISSLASLITKSSTAALNENINLEAEINKFQLDYSGIDSRMRAFWQAVKINPSKFSKGSVLLTGATGFVGCFLLEQLMLHTETTVYCLVRESPDKSPMERLAQAREQFGLRKFLSPDRTIPIKGDVSLNNFGLSKDMYNALTLEIDTVIHAAAQVNLILPFSALYSSNVIGTYNVLKFSLDGKIKPIHYISTSSVFPDEVKNVKESSDITKFCNQQDTGYGQTKWLGEQLILFAAQKGLPTAIYRCGNVGGSRLVAGWNPLDFNFHMLRGVLKTGFAPDINWQIEMTPVDFVSQVIIHLVDNLQESVGKVFHLINNNTFDCKHLWDILKGVGYNISTTCYGTWYALIEEEGQKDVQLTQLSHLLQNLVIKEEFFTKVSTYSNTNLSAVLKKMNLTYPSLTPELFALYIEGLSNLDLIPKPFQHADVVKPQRNLKGKIILVTGASSGIGEGIARSLALAGAKVLLAARRLDRLQKIAQELQKSGAEVLPIELDVCNAIQVSNCVQQIEATVGSVDVLVNNAGVMYYQFIKSCDLPRWQHMVDVNINGTLNCLASVISRMVARGSGHIVNISSDGARKPFPGLAVYCGTKYFIRCLSGAMRSELASSGIKVTDIQPGDVTSELHNHVSDPEAELTYDWSAKVPILKPSDVGQAVLYALTQPSYCAVNEILIEPELLPL